MYLWSKVKIRHGTILSTILTSHNVQNKIYFIKSSLHNKQDKKEGKER